MQLAYTYNTSLGKITIVEENQQIIQISFGENKLENVQTQQTQLIKQKYEQITQYLEGKRKEFNVPINPKGTPFQQKVWKALLTIPYGKTSSYQEIAQKIGNPKGSRAVGMANHNNPIAIIIPCHRVIGKNGKLVGYAGGITIKEKLLKLEQK